ncbi:MAG: tetratricopeptide repeat protein [Flavobacteriales bacterium]|jgi:tetratricopeptide (TPR) repeat protein|nr:tetratricopeptide repeat protein [Flavobacteriales bacterium]
MTTHGRLLAAALASALMSVCHGQTAERYLQTGDSLLRLEKPQRALEFLDKAVAMEPSAKALMLRSRAFYMLDRMDRFLLDVEASLRADSTLAEAHYQRGLYAMRANEFVQAEHSASKAIAHTKEPPLKAKAFILRGEARAELKRYGPAIEDLELGTQGGTTDLEAMRTLARLLDLAGRHDASLKVLERLCELEPSDVGHWTNRSFELIMLGRFEEAMPMVEKALSFDKDEPVALSNRAYIHLKLGREQEAWKDIERSLRSYPSNPYALRTRALLRLKKGERSKACEDLTLAKALGEVAEVNALIKEHCGAEKVPKRR